MLERFNGRISDLVKQTHFASASECENGCGNSYFIIMLKCKKTLAGMKIDYDFKSN